MRAADTYSLHGILIYLASCGLACQKAFPIYDQRVKIDTDICCLPRVSCLSVMLSWGHSSMRVSLRVLGCLVLARNYTISDRDAKRPR